MAGEIVKITGIDEVQAMLSAAPKNIVLLGYARALNAGINVIAAAVVERTPISGRILWNDETFSEFKDFTGGDLASAAITDVEIDGNARGGIAEFGFGKQGHIANFVEYGHRMVTHKPGKKVVGEVQARPFMRPAFDAAGDAAIDAFAQSLLDTLKLEY